MINPIVWIKSNKMSALLLALVLGLVYMLSRNQMGTSLRMDSYESGIAYDAVGMSAPSMGMAKSSLGSQLTNSFNPSFQEAAPTTDVSNRMVVTNSYLSLVVKDVNAGVNSIKTYVQSLGGYMVNSDISRPEEGGTGTITVRIPSEKLDAALAQVKGQAVKVVSENMSGSDVTDQFVDNEARLVILERNKATFEKIMDAAVDVSEILQVQSQIFSLQSQIDSIKGQQKYLEQTSKLALVTFYLSTDELALPYAPVEAWRPEVIFKHAVRSLMSTAQGVGTLVIWLAVYAIIWLPIALILLYLAKRKRKSPAGL